MSKYMIKFNNSYWKGTLSQIARWATEKVLNDTMFERQQAAKAWLASSESVEEIISNLDAVL